MKKPVYVFILFLFLLVPGMSQNAYARYKKPKLGVTWMQKSSMQDTIFNSMKKELSAIAPEIEIEQQIALPDEQSFQETVKRFDMEKDAMVILRSPCVSYLKEYKTSIPTFIGGCNNPVLLGVMTNLEKPEGNITGITYHLQPITHMEVFTTILPEMKSIMILTQANHSSSDIEIDNTIQAGKKWNLKVSSAKCPDAATLLEVVENNKDKVDAFIIGTQAIPIDNTSAVVKHAGKVPVFAYSEKPISAGALCGFSANDAKLGIMLAHSIKQVLIDKKPISLVPVKQDPQPKLFLNLKTAQQLNIEIPLEILEIATFKD